MTIKRFNTRAAVEAVKQSLSAIEAPSLVAKAHERFRSAVHGRPNTLKPPPLPEAWKLPYRDLITDLDKIKKKPSPGDLAYAEKVHEGIQFTALLDRLYGPANGKFLAPDHRYTIEWTYRDTLDNAGSQSASKASGDLHVVNVLSPMPPPQHPAGTFVGGTAHAGVGFLFRPKHAMSTFKMTPHVPYSYHYLVDHPTSATLSIAKTRGALRLVCYRVNLFNNTSVVHAEWEKKLWEAENQPIASRHEGQKSGTFNGFPVQLDFTASGDFVYALLCIATVSVTRGYYGQQWGSPVEPTLCTGNLSCNISSMWLDEEKLA
jgi:hypothetical protein